MTDRGDATASWNDGRQAVPATRSPSSAGRESLNQVRTPLGPLSQRALSATRFRTSFPGAPDGDYAMVVFRTSFAKKIDARARRSRSRTGARRRVARDRLSVHHMCGELIVGPASRHPPMADATPSDASSEDEQDLAQQKFSCPACGAEAVWNPGKQALVCPFCGTTSPAKRSTDAGVIVEHDLVSCACAASPTTSAAGKSRSATSNARAARRSRCWTPQRQAQRCEFCGSAQLVPYEAGQGRFPSRERAAVHDQRGQGARRHPRLVRQAVAGTERSSSAAR